MRLGRVDPDTDEVPADPRPEDAVERASERPVAVLGELMAVGDDQPDVRRTELRNCEPLAGGAVERAGEQRNLR